MNVKPAIKYFSETLLGIKKGVRENPSKFY